MTSDQDAKVVAEPQGQRVQEGKDGAHLVSVPCVPRLAGPQPPSVSDPGSATDWVPQSQRASCDLSLGVLFCINLWVG